MTCLGSRVKGLECTCICIRTFFGVCHYKDCSILEPIVVSPDWGNYYVHLYADLCRGRIRNQDLGVGFVEFVVLLVVGFGNGFQVFLFGFV